MNDFIIEVLSGIKPPFLYAVYDTVHTESASRRIRHILAEPRLDISLRCCPTRIHVVFTIPLHWVRNATRLLQFGSRVQVRFGSQPPAPADGICTITGRGARPPTSRRHADQHVDHEAPSHTGALCPALITRELQVHCSLVFFGAIVAVVPGR